jgi:molybdenum cofactor biosynthesis enzyme MoaA
MTIDKTKIITDGQDLAERVDVLKAEGVTDVTVVVNTLNFTKYKETNDGKELQPVIDGINRAYGAEMKITLQVGIKEGYNEEEILDMLQLTFQHRYDIVFLPTMDYDKIKAKMPALMKVNGEFEGVEMFKYPGAVGRIGFLLN